jgi:hypothetical protein
MLMWRLTSPSTKGSSSRKMSTSENLAAASASIAVLRGVEVNEAGVELAVAVMVSLLPMHSCAVI